MRSDVMPVEASAGRLSPATRLWESIRRRTASGLYLAELDGLRFIAIASVFFYHLAGDILRHATPGAGASYRGAFVFDLTQKLSVGVPLFFVISGMILSLPFAGHYLTGRPAVRLPKYFLRRLTRLEPPYILTLVLFLLLKLSGGRGSLDELFPHFLASLFYVHNWVYQKPSEINIVAWSLEIEVQFYLLVPVLIGVFAIRSAVWRRASIAIAIAGLAAVNSVPAWREMFHLSLLGHLHFFLTGFLLSDFYWSGHLAEGAGRAWDAIAAVGWPIFFAGLVYGGRPFAAMLPWLMLALYCAAFKGRGTRRALSTPWVAGIGGMCYSIYLIHNYVIALTGFVTERFLLHADFVTRLALQTVLHAGPVLLASLILYKLVEQPCMNPRWPSEAAAFLRRRLSPA